MRILICASGNAPQISPFVKEQGDSLKKLGIHIDYFLIKGKGIIGYLKNYSLQKINLYLSRMYVYDLVLK